MSSTIPKAVLPFGERLLFDAALENLTMATDGQMGLFYAAVGFRSELVQVALGTRVRYLEYSQTLGLAFRVATCLETLARQGHDDRLVVLTYTDMPLVSPNRIRDLIARVNEPRKFGILVSHNYRLSGHIARNGRGSIVRVIQKRLHPEQCLPNMERDVGVYVFYNTAELREALGAIRNDNLRREFIFADLVEILVQEEWEIKSHKEEFMPCLSVNTAADLLNLVSKAYDNDVPMASVRNVIWQHYGLAIPDSMDLVTLRAKIEHHTGPFYFFDWWDQIWSV
jgi:bifunctional N-acetylglucosamine-1-phosphate-uridyltransferase/glucosamine-1-phosphate-acetyltransferase GlmU-like protein